MSRLTRQEMKRDEVREFLSRAFLFLGENRRRIGIGLAVVALLAIVATVAARMIGGRRAEASDALAAALEVPMAPLRSELSPGVTAEGPVFDSEETRRAAAKERFEALVSEYPGTETARIARSYVARLELEAGRPEVAREIWAEIADDGGDDALTMQIVLNLLELDRSQGAAASAEERLLGMLDDPRSILPQATVLYELAVTQELLGKVEESRATYQRILDEHPTSPHARTAARKAAPPDGAA